MSEKLKSLGSTQTNYKYNEPEKNIIECFDSPFKNKKFKGRINIEVPEFTTLCPKTGQPDFGKIVIDYIPGNLCVESKSLKLYLGGFRMHGEFHEGCVYRIAKDLVDILDPEFLSVEGQFTPRGGIPFWPKVVYEK